MPRRTIDGFRTAPIGFLHMAILGGGGDSAIAYLGGPDFYRDPAAICILATNSLQILFGALKVCRQFELRDRLQDSIESHGYDERVMEKTIHQYCDRQTARVVCQNTGDLEQYVELCEDNKYSLLNRRLPHV